MKPVSPVYLDSEDRWGVKEITFAKDQPEYIPLPALRFQDGLVVTRWSLSWRERIEILLGGSFYLGMLTFNKPLQPIRISTSVDEVVGLMADGPE
jgi:hypothetical protein